MIQFTLNGEFCDLNTYINGERRNRYIGAKIKKEATERAACGFFGVSGVDSSAKYDYMFDWYVPSKRKDPDNVAFAKKFILDGMVKAGVIDNDGQKNVGNFRDNFHIDKENPRVVITMILSGSD